MHQDEEIRQLLREIKEAQVQHHEEWRAALRRTEELQQRALHNAARAKRNGWIIIGVLILILLGASYLPSLWLSRHAPADFPERGPYASLIATPLFDGSYTLDPETLSSLREHLADMEGAKPERVERLVAMTQEQFQNFRIRHGVITSGTKLVQEFRLISGTNEIGQFQGRAIWHEDIRDSGDCALVNVCLRLEGEVLRFCYYPDGEPPGDPVILRRKAP
jgi:hypothetical protein